MPQYNDDLHKSRGSIAVTGQTLVREGCPACGHTAAIADGSVVECTRCNHAYDPGQSEVLIADGAGRLDAEDHQDLADLKTTADLWLAVEWDHGTEYIRYDRDDERWVCHFDPADDAAVKANILLSPEAIETRFEHNTPERCHSRDVPAEVRQADD